MKFTDLFADFGDFSKYVDGLTADTTYDQLTASINTVGMDIIKIITADAYIAIAESEDDCKDLLKTAMAAGTMLKYQIFNSVKKNGSEASMYKYQHEELKEHYASAYWKAMDALLDWLDANPETGGYSDTLEYRDRQQLPVKSASEFNRYYGIDNSALFFSKVLFLLRHCWYGKIKTMVGAHQDDETIMEHAKTALCYMTMAKAVMQFDATELPRSIRWDFNHEYTRGSQMQDRDRLYRELNAQAEAELSSLQNLIKLATSDAIRHNQNKEDNKFYSTL